MSFLRNITLKIAVGEKRDFAIRGDTIRVISSTTGGVKTYFETKGGESSFYLEVGEEATFNDLNFFSIEISHDAGVEQTLVLAVGEGAKIGSAKVSGAVTITSGSVTISTLTPTRATGANTNPAVTNVSAQLVAVNASRSYLLIQNKDAVGNIYINFGAAATVANGIKIPSNGSFELNCNVLTAVINAIGDIASNNNVVVVTG